MSELKPCPFCGDSKAYISRETDPDNCLWVKIQCRKCDAASSPKWCSRGNDDPLFYEEIREAWNRRADQVSQQDAVSVPREWTYEMVKAFEDNGGKFSHMALEASLRAAQEGNK
jgi:hypothetical protein